MILQSIFAFNIVVHVVLGAFVLKILLKGLGIKTGWQQSGLLALAVVIGMQLVTRAMMFFGASNKLILAVVALWSFVGAGLFLSKTYGLKEKKLYLVAGMWGLALMVISLLISILDRILLFGL
ncbi:MAG: hypothetical protein HY363_00590 [Candidatus Aenigmarchaeota archaeon]|nr:hypothetical protein [Candidatus Aenigmarchaeota archaeon]